MTDFEENRGGMIMGFVLLIAAGVIIFYAMTHPSGSHVLMKEAISLWQDGKLDESLESFNKIIAKEPTLAVAYFNRASVFLEKMDYKNALKDLESAIALDSSWADAHYNRGVLLYKMGNLEESLKEFDITLLLEPKNKHALLNKGIVLSEMDKIDEAANCFDQAILVDPNFRAAIYQRQKVKPLFNRKTFPGFETENKDK